MDLPVERILWAPTNSAHDNHLHVVGEPRRSGHPPHENPGMTDSIEVIVAALDLRFGPGAFYKNATAETGWTHMGIWNRRYIAGTTTWSQHAYANAIDIGPYYGVEQQQKFYDFLTGKDEMVFTNHEIKELKKIVAALDEVGSNGGFAKYAVRAIRRERDAGGYAPAGHDHPDSNGGVTESQVVQAIQNHSGDPDAHHE